MSRQAIDIGRGKVAEFVRWTSSRDGWQPELVTGTFVNVTANGWRIIEGDRVLVLNSDEWDWCAR